MKKNLVIALLLALSLTSNGQTANPSKMDWWNEAKLGLFVHWGPYSLYGGVYNGFNQRRGGCEWIMNRCKIPVAEYRAKASTFNPVEFNADKLVLMAKNAGMKYVVITTKHHDGFAMFQSDASQFNIVDYTPFGRDVIDEVVRACRRHGMKIGFYYSQSQDWCNAGGATARKDMSEGWSNPDSTYINQFTKSHKGAWDYRQLEKSFDAYFHDVALPQMKELLTRYPDLAVIFFDTPMNISDQEAQEMYDLVKGYPDIIVNDRLKRPNFPGDYKTPEGRVPQAEEVEGVYWETCMNIGSSWGYKSWEKNWKSSETILKTIITIAARGGNLLLNVGPDALGNVPQEAQDCLSEVGKWMSHYGQAIYGTQRSGLQPSWGEVIRKDEDGTSVFYLCVFDWPADGRLVLKGNGLRAKTARLLSDSERLKVSSRVGETVIQLPSEKPSETIPVIRLVLSNRLPEVRLVSNTQKYFSIIDEK